jgi:hypothetical protein
MKKRLGEILIERGLIDVDQLNSALSHQRQWGMRLGAALVAKGFVAEGMLTRVLSESLGFPMVDLSRIVVEPRALQLVPRRVCEQHDVLPLAIKEQHGRKLLFLAMADPLNATVIDEVAFTTGAVVKPAIAQISSLEQAIRRYYLGQRVEIAPLNFDARLKSTAFANSEPMTIVGAGGASERVVVGRQAIDTNTLVQLDSEAEIPVDAVMPLAPFSAPSLPSDYLGQRTGVFAMPSLQPGELAPPTPTVEVAVADADIVAMTRSADHEQLEALERKFWALMRALARRGLITKEEFLTELQAADE